MKSIKAITATPDEDYGYGVVITDNRGHNFDYDCPDVLDAILDYLGIEVEYDYDCEAAPQQGCYLTEELKEY